MVDGQHPRREDAGGHGDEHGEGLGDRFLFETIIAHHDRKWNGAEGIDQLRKRQSPKDGIELWGVEPNCRVRSSKKHDREEADPGEKTEPEDGVSSGFVGLLVRNERRDQATDPEHFSERDNRKRDGDNTEILGHEQPREDDRSEESGAALTDKSEDLPEETFDGGSPETAQNL